MHTSFPPADFVRISLDGNQKYDTGSCTLPKTPSCNTLVTSSESLNSEFSQPRQLLSGIRLALAVISLSILMFMSALDTTIVATTYIPIGNALDSLDIAEWIITSYLISVTAFQPLYGTISDLLGRIETLIFAVLVFLLGSIICAVATNMPMLIASRALQGVGGAGLMSMSLIIVADIINERERSKYVGVFSGTYGIAAAIGPVIGGAIVQNTKWQVIFWINIPFCAIALIMIAPFLCIPRSQGTLVEKLKRIDFLGALLCIVGIVSLLLGLSWGGREYSWSSVQVICTLVFGLLGIVLFAWYESKLPLVPLVPIHLFKIRNVVCASGSSLLFGFAVNGAFMFIPQWAQIVKQASPVVSGAYLVPYCVGMIVSSTICGILVSRTGRCYEFIIGGAATMLLGNGLLIMLGSGNNELGKVVGFLLISGLGMGACVFTINLIGQASVSGKHMAAVTSAFLFFRSLGMVLSVSVLSNIIQNVLRDKVSDFAEKFPMFAGRVGDMLKNHALLYSDQVPQLFVDDFISAYSEALRSAFIALTAFTALFFVASFGFKHVELHTVLKK